MKEKITCILSLITFIQVGYVQCQWTNQEFTVKERSFSMNWNEAQLLCTNSTKEKGLLYKENMKDLVKIDHAMKDKRQTRLWVNFITQKPSFSEFNKENRTFYWESGLSFDQKVRVPEEKPQCASLSYGRGRNEVTFEDCSQSSLFMCAVPDFNGQCIKLLSGKRRRTWLDAREYCAERSGRLVEYSGADERAHLKESLRGYGKIWLGLINRVWTRGQSTNDPDAWCGLIDLTKKQLEMRPCTERIGSVAMCNIAIKSKEKRTRRPPSKKHNLHTMRWCKL